MKRLLIFVGIALGTAAYCAVLIFAPLWVLACIFSVIAITGVWKMSGYLAR